ncbi:hypothetical protein QQF64_036261 [Cirrhinus molitorella]|uniref:L1 transposable element RRM domain-containing protein n=1 Tax=Cirrhinus molitorella TaxID=172907 RepID=A0ABR3NIX8_9TELE
MSSQKLIKPAKLKLDSKEKEPLPNFGKKEEARHSVHDYAMEVTMQSKRERADRSLPSTPSKTPAEKKAKPTFDSEKSEISNEVILEAILNLEKRVDEKLADLSEQSKQSSAMIASLTKAIQFNSEEVNECKKRVKDLEIQNDLLRKDNGDLKERVREQERYRMRWCLRIKGIEEKKDEDIRSHVVQILAKIAPELETKMDEAVDIVHRMGKKMDNKNRIVIVLFTQRRVKEEIWRRSKNSLICKEEGVRFAEMLPREDLDIRRKLWPQIDQARRAGKQAFFRGPYGFIDGKRIDPEG